MFEHKVRKSDEEWKIERQDFSHRFTQSFKDPYFNKHQEKISELEERASIYSQVGRYIGYYGTYAESHRELDKDKAIINEVRNASESLYLAIQAEREKKLISQLPQLNDPRPK